MLARDPISPFTFDYRGRRVVLTKKRKRWCFSPSPGDTRCGESFRAAVIEAKHMIDFASGAPWAGEQDEGGLSPPATAALIIIAGAAITGGIVYFATRPSSTPTAPTATAVCGQKGTNYWIRHPDGSVGPGRYYSVSVPVIAGAKASDFVAALSSTGWTLDPNGFWTDTTTLPPDWPCDDLPPTTTDARWRLRGTYNGQALNESQGVNVYEGELTS